MIFIHSIEKKLKKNVLSFSQERKQKEEGREREYNSFISASSQIVQNKTNPFVIMCV